MRRLPANLGHVDDADGLQQRRTIWGRVTRPGRPAASRVDGICNELRQAILKRFRVDGIEMPFPTRTIYVKEQGAK